MSTSSCPYDAKYITSINKSNKDDLNNGEILISSDCNYIVIRNPSSYLSFYSIKDQSIIHKWHMHTNDSIWSINDNNFQDAQILHISTSGCLSFINTNAITYSTICNTKSPNPISQKQPSHISSFQLSSSNINTKTNPLLSLNGSNFEENLALIISSILIQIFVIIFFILMFVLWHRCKKHKYEFIEIPGGKSKSIEIQPINNIPSDSENDDELDDQIDEIQFQLSKLTPISREVTQEPDDKKVTLRVLSIMDDTSNTSNKDERKELIYIESKLKHSSSGHNLTPIDNDQFQYDHIDVKSHIQEILGKDTTTLERKLSVINSFSDDNITDV
eukprot:520490_1